MLNLKKIFRQDTVVFIDGANLFYAQRELQERIDYHHLYRKLKEYPRLKEVRIYLSQNMERPQERHFLEKLRRIGFNVIAKPLKHILDREGTLIVRKGNLDIELALDAFELKERFRTMVLLSGDSDFEILLTRLKNNSKRCVVISAKGRLSSELARSAHVLVFLEEFFNKKSRA